MLACARWDAAAALLFRPDGAMGNASSCGGLF
jgi:hypothetical protein